MKKFRTILSTALFTLFAFAVVFISCRKDFDADVCDAVLCENGGTCNPDGSCNCPAGYGGPLCQFSGCFVTPCQNGGFCLADTCQCNNGFEGRFCEKLTKEKYLGAWTVNEDGSNSAPQQYDVTVTSGPSNTQIFIQNFHNNGTTDIYAFVDHDSFIIYQQNIGNGYVEGRGYFMNTNPATLKVKYYFQDFSGGGGSDDFGWQTNAAPAVWNR
jgi:hypothetical protein